MLQELIDALVRANNVVNADVDTYLKVLKNVNSKTWKADAATAKAKAQSSISDARDALRAAKAEFESVWKALGEGEKKLDKKTQDMIDKAYLKIKLTEEAINDSEKALE